MLAFYVVYSAIRNATKAAPARRSATRGDSSAGNRRSASTTRRRSSDWALHFKPLDHRGELLLRIAALRRHDRRRRSSCSASAPTTTRAGATRSRVATAIALIGFSFSAHAAAPAALRHYGFVDTLAKYPTFWSFNSGAVKQDLEPVRGDAERALRWALWCACALVPRAQAPVGQGARGCSTRCSR